VAPNARAGGAFAGAIGDPAAVNSFGRMNRTRQSLNDPAFQQAGPNDLKRVLAFVKLYYEFDGIAFRAGQVRAALEILLRDPTLGRVWIIHSLQRDVGYLTVTFGFDLELGGRVATITEFYLVSAHRRRGLGTKAVRYVEAMCRELGIGAIELQVERDNTEARSFYRKLGFEAHDRIPLSKMVLE
jgi:ribosomal protein S18 acetylase RimI-like enzyme